MQKLKSAPGGGKTPPPAFRVTSKRGPAEKATPATNATPTPTPGMKHRKAEDEETQMLLSSKKALFLDGGEEDDEKISYLPKFRCTGTHVNTLPISESLILGLGSTTTPGQGAGRKP